MCVGVLGSTGNVGKYVCKKLLKSGVSVIGGQRHENIDFTEYANFTSFKIDILNLESLKSFCEKCSIEIGRASCRERV